MALKRTVSKEEHAKLDEGIKGLYIEDGDGFRLDLDGGEDTGALKRAKDREVQLRKDAETKLREAQERLDELSGNDAKKRGDIEALEKSWKEKNDKLSTESQAQINKLKASTEKHLRDGNARAIAAKISNAPELLYPHLVSRMTVDYDGDEPKLRILDAEGKPSAMTIDELSAEFVANKNYAAIMVASKASGGGAPGGQQQQQKGRAQSEGGRVDLSKMSTQERVAHYRAIREQSQK